MTFSSPPRELEELSALKEVEEAAIAEAEAAAAEAANAAAGLFDFEDEDESETASPSKKSPEKGTGVRMIDNNNHYCS